MVMESSTLDRIFDLFYSPYLLCNYNSDIKNSQDVNTNHKLAILLTSITNCENLFIYCMQFTLHI